MGFFSGIIVMLMVWVLVEKKNRQCSLSESARLVINSLFDLFGKPEQSVNILDDPDFRMEMESILNRYSVIPPNYTCHDCNRSDLPFYVCQISCSDSDKPVVEHLIGTAVKSSLLRKNVGTEVIIEWIQYKGMPAVKCVYASTVSEREIFGKRIEQIKRSKINNPVIDEELEQELKEYGC